jgi:hypothetical protein
MAQVKYNPEEKDDNYAIEEAIVGKLRAGETAEVMVEHIEKVLPSHQEGKGDSDEDEIVENASLSEKCDAICTNLAIATALASRV